MGLLIRIIVLSVQIVLSEYDVFPLCPNSPLALGLFVILFSVALLQNVYLVRPCQSVSGKIWNENPMSL